MYCAFCICSIVGGTLSDYRHTFPNDLIPEADMKFYAAEILLALNHL